MFSVVIPSATASNLIPCVDSILKMEPDLKPSQIIVVDDGAKYGAEHILPKEVRWVDGKKPFVFSRNCNIGFDVAGEDDVILCNDDIVLKSQGGFTQLVRAAANYGISSAVTNSAGNPNQRPQSGKGGIRFDPRVLAFVCVCIPRVVYEAIGRLDERFIAYGSDDNDYCRRAVLAGYKLCIVDGCYVDHMTLTSTYRGKNKPGDISAGQAIFKEKWGVGLEDVPKC